MPKRYFEHECHPHLEHKFQAYILAPGAERAQLEIDIGKRFLLAFPIHFEDSHTEEERETMENLMMVGQHLYELFNLSDSLLPCP